MAMKSWSTTAGDNDDADASINWLEGQAPSTVNGSARAMMAASRLDYENREWRDWGHTVTYASATTFTIATDVTAVYVTGRPIKCTDSSTLYGKVASSSYSAPNTTVTVTLDSGSLSASLTAVALGFDPTGDCVDVSGVRGAVDNSTNQTVAGNKTLTGTTVISGATTLSGVNTISGVTTMSAKALWTAEGADVASASDCNIWSAADGNTVHVTGTSAIMDWGTAPQAGAGMWVIFDGALQLTYDATTNKLNTGGANYTTAAGDRAFVYAESTSSYVVTIFPLDGSPVSLIATADITDANVTQAKLANSSVGQAQLKTSTQQSTGTSSAVVTTALTGGLYSLQTTFATNGNNYTLKSVNTTTYATSVTIDCSGGGVDYYIQCRYVTASPPYDLGDGDIPLFVYAEVTPGGQVVRVDAAQDPPWIYNGPNRLNPYKLRYAADGRVYMRQRAILAEHGSIGRAIAAGVGAQVALARLRNDPNEDVEITTARKNLDMPVVPHPFGNVTPGNTVVLLDPVSPVARQLLDLHELNDPDATVGSFIKEGRLVIGNTSLPRTAPPGVVPVQVRWRLTP